MLGAAPAPSPCAEPAGAAADEPAGAVPPGAELDEVSGEDPEGDEGGVARFDEMQQRLARGGIDMQALRRQAGSGSLRLPFVWVYGRRDHTISVMGANIYPEDLEQCLYAEPMLSRITHSFCLALAEGAGGAVNPKFLFEVDAEPSAALALTFREAMLRRLLALNADFREAWKEYPQTVQPVIELHRRGTGPFAVDSTRIKQIRLVKTH